MSAKDNVMTPELSREACRVIQAAREKAYAKKGLTRKVYDGEISEGALIPWEDTAKNKAKMFCLECFRQEIGLKPADKSEIDVKGNLTFIVQDYGSKGQTKKDGGNGKG